jgi:hypothetical protein
MRHALSLAALLILTGSLSAQTPRVVSAIPCPIGFTVQRSPGLTVRTIQNGKAAPAEQGLNLTFDHRLRPAIAQVALTVHGTDFTAHLKPLAGSAPDLTEQFTLTPNPGETLTQSLIEMQHVKNARWIQLNEVQFANGSIWRPTQSSRCIASISLYLPVDSAVGSASH